jgi:ABC-2 type transport system permease protein
MPRWARTIGEALPLTHMVGATRGILLKGESAARVAAEMIPVAMFAMIAAGVALVAYRPRID